MNSMNTKPSVLLVVFALGMMISLGQGVAQARGWAWAKRLPISQFSAEDTAIFHRNVNQALADAGNGERVSWENPLSGAAGAITPLTTEQRDGKTCRRTRFESQTPTSENISEFMLCQQADGSWSVEAD